MFSQRINLIQAALCVLLLSCHSLAGNVDIKQSEGNLEIRNDKLVLSIAKGKPGAGISYQLGATLHPATTLIVVQKDAPAATVRTFRLVNEFADMASVEVEYMFANGATVTVSFSLRDHFEYVEVESDYDHGKAALSATMKSEVMVLPDFLGESSVYYPETAPAETMTIPADNQVLVNLLDRGDGMLALLWESSGMSISESKMGNLFDSVTLSADGKSRFWIGAIAASGLWYKAAESLNLETFTVLNWTQPFPAEWTMATLLDKGLHVDTPTCESWRLVQRVAAESSPPWIPVGNGVGILNVSIWQAWASGLGRFIYPCYFQDGKAFAKSVDFPNMTNLPAIGASPCLIYALKGNETTPASVTLPVTAIKKLLSNEVISRIEAGISPKNIYPATCGITEQVEKIFYRSESVNEKDRIVSDFSRMNMFVVVIRERIEEYVSWQREMSRILDDWMLQDPHLVETAGALNRNIAGISLLYEKKKDRMKTPTFCNDLAGKIIALTDANLSDEEKEDKCKDLGRQIRIIGGAQDDSLGVFRCIVKGARMDATRKLLAATDSKTKELLQNVRTETASMLTGRFGMEGK